MFLGKNFPIQLYIGFLEKSVKNKYASIGRVAHWAGYGNNAQNRHSDFFDEQRLIFVPICSLSRGLSENVIKNIKPSGPF